MSNIIKEFFKCAFNEQPESLSHLLAGNSRLLANKNNYLGIKSIEEYINTIRSGLSNISFKKEDLYNRANLYGFKWNITGIQTGVFNGYLPSNKKISYSGLGVAKCESNLIRSIEIVYDEKTIEQQIISLSNHQYKEEDIINDLNGEAGKIYQLMLSTRDGITDSKQTLVNELRRAAMVAPDLSLLNHSLIKTLKAEVKVTHFIIPGETHKIDAFLYTPINADSKNLPTIIYYHGGGWIMGSPEGYDIANRQLSLASHVNVICIRYRLAPEHPYPAGFDDCTRAYRWLRDLPHDNEININPKWLAVAGDSAGGTFAASVTIRMHNEKFKLPDAVLLFSPSTDMYLERYESYNKMTKNNMMLDQGLLGFIRGAYVSGDKWLDPYFSPIYGDLSIFPDTFVLIGEADPLFDENMAFYNKLKSQSSNHSEVCIGKEMPHHYNVFVGLSPQVDQAYKKIADFIKLAFTKTLKDKL